MLSKNRISICSLKHTQKFRQKKSTHPNVCQFFFVIKQTSYLTFLALCASIKRVFSNVLALLQHSVGPVSGRDIIKVFKFCRCCEHIHASYGINWNWNWYWIRLISPQIGEKKLVFIQKRFNITITCATLDELRLNVSFNRLNEACSLAMNRCSCRNECAKSIISSKFPLLIDCIFVRSVYHTQLS